MSLTKRTWGDSSDVLFTFTGSVTGPDADALLQALERKYCGSLEERGALEQGKSGTTRRRVLFSCAAVLTAALLLFVGRGVWKEKPAAPVQRETAAPTAEVRGSEELRILNETDPDGNVVIALTMEKALQVSTSQPDAELRWSSEDTSVASVDPSGVVTGVSPVTTIITVSCGSASASVPVKVALRDTYTLENLTEKERAFFLNYCNSIISYADASDLIPAFACVRLGTTAIPSFPMRTQANAGMRSAGLTRTHSLTLKRESCISSRPHKPIMTAISAISVPITMIQIPRKWCSINGGMRKMTSGNAVIIMKDFCFRQWIRTRASTKPDITGGTHWKERMNRDANTGRR